MLGLRSLGRRDALELLGQQRGRHPGLDRALVDIERLLHYVGDKGDRAEYIVDGIGSAAGIALGLAQQYIGLEANQILLMPGDICLDLIGRMCLGKGVGVVARRQQHYLERKPGSHKHVDTSQRRLDTRRVGVVDERDGGGKALDEFDLAVGERCARRGHHILHPGLVHGYDIHVSLDQDALLLAGDGGAGLIQSV